MHVGPLEQRRKRLVERAGVVVEEVLLELVEDQERLAVGIGQRRLDRPFVEHDDLGLRRDLAQATCDGGAENRALADPARPVEDGQLRREHVRDDDLGLALAPEEEEGVELGVLERRKALVRRGDARRRRAHAAASFVSPR